MWSRWCRVSRCDAGKGAIIARCVDHHILHENQGYTSHGRGKLSAQAWFLFKEVRVMSTVLNLKDRPFAATPCGSCSGSHSDRKVRSTK